MTRRILAIDTSCDETAAAVVGEDSSVLSSVVFSQADLHGPHGGVVPELASREHVGRITPVVDEALRESSSSPDDLSAVAVTRGPGLIGCLAVGIATAKSLALAWDKPLVAVNHLEGHVFSIELDRDEPRYPAVVLLVSGGHCQLIHARERGSYEVLGATRDDSPGEAFDKVARELGLGYPGGPVIDRLALEGRDAYGFPRPLLDETYDFSFSGLKTAVRRHLETHQVDVPDIAASFAAAVNDVLVAKLARAVDELAPATVAVVGGVAASPILRERLRTEVRSESDGLVLPAQRYATDNAAMIGAAGWWRFGQAGPSRDDFGPVARLGLVSGGDGAGS
jgi:N6-L-threonylcarbamoyladenine synthase